jgi:hypothetical protein
MFGGHIPWLGLPHDERGAANKRPAVTLWLGRLLDEPLHRKLSETIS